MYDITQPDFTLCDPCCVTSPTVREGAVPLHQAAGGAGRGGGPQEGGVTAGERASQTQQD
jgi:hypothetical protein